MTTDIITGVDLAAYYADMLTPGVCLSQSIAHTLTSRCEKAAWAEHPRLGGKPRRVGDPAKLGTLIDELLLGDGQRIAEIDAPDFKTKAAQVLRDEALAAGKLPATAPKLADWRATVERVRTSLKYGGVPFDGQRGVCVLWEETATNGNKVQCKGLLDHLKFDELLIQDLKTGADCRPDTLRGKIRRYGYDIQAAAYTRAVESVLGPSVAGRVNFEHVWMETDWPHITLRSQLSGKAMLLGNLLWQRAVDRWEKALRTNFWPAYSRPDEVLIIEPKEYDEAAALELLEEDEDAP